MALVTESGKICAEISTHRKDFDDFEYCFVEMMRPNIKDAFCREFVSHIGEGRFRCDSKGMMYYEDPTIPVLGPSPTKREISKHVVRVMSKYVYRSIATCLFSNKNTHEKRECADTEKYRMRGIFDVCGDEPVPVDAPFKTFEKCIETRSKLY
jgi:hypothetical protein